MKKIQENMGQIFGKICTKLYVRKYKYRLYDNTK